MLRTSSPCYRCTTAVAKFAAVTAIFLLLSEIREGGGLKETFLKTATLSVLVWAYPREMKPNNENFKIAAVLPRWCYYGNIDVPIPLRIWNFSCVTSMRTYFAAVYHGLFLRSSAAFVVLRILRSFVERFYLLKKHDCKTWSVSIYHLKS